MGVDQWTNLLSWPAAILSVTYFAWAWRRYRLRMVPVERVMLALLVVVAVAGFLLRPLTALGVLNEETRDYAAIGTRVLFLIVMGGLVWNLIDHWRDERRMRRDS